MWGPAGFYIKASEYEDARHTLSPLGDQVEIDLEDVRVTVQPF